MDKLIKPVFTLDLGFKVLPGLVTIGKYDGSHPCLTAATMADKVRTNYKLIACKNRKFSAFLIYFRRLLFTVLTDVPL